MGYISIRMVLAETLGVVRRVEAQMSDHIKYHNEVHIW
jgi:hypothetical protein